MRLIDADKLIDDYNKSEGTISDLMELILDAAEEATPPNDPLTLEQLREMGGEPYWHVGLQDDSEPPHWNILDSFFAKHIEDYGYRKRWIAYRYKPEET